jgi:hypothetical protein
VRQARGEISKIGRRIAVSIKLLRLGER